MMIRRVFSALAVASLLFCEPADAWLIQAKIPNTTYPSYVNGSTWQTAASATSMTLLMPASIVSGNVLIAITTVAASRSPTWSAGWTAIGAGFAAYRVATGSDTAPTVSWTGSSNQTGIISQWTGATHGVGATNDNQAQTGSPATVSEITTTAAYSIGVAGIISGINSVPSNPSGYTSDASSSVAGGAVRWAHVDVQFSGTGTGNVSSTVNSSNVWRATLVELKAN